MDKLWILLVCTILLHCGQRELQWISEKDVHALQFAGTNPYQVFNLKQVTDITKSIAVKTYAMNSGFELYYFLESGDSAKVNVYLFDSELNAFGAFKYMGGDLHDRGAPLKWFKNALFDFKIDLKERYTKELHSFSKNFPSVNVPVAYQYFPIQSRIKDSEAMSTQGVCGMFPLESFISIDYLVEGETTTLAKSVASVPKVEFDSYIEKVQPIDTQKIDEFTMFLVEVSGGSVWVSYADSRVIAVFGASSLKKSLYFLKKSLNIQKILN